MNLNLSPESADRRWRLGCAAALAIYAIIGGIAVYVSRDSINPDGVAYIQSARNYAAGRFDLAFNGWFSPMLSWLLTLAVWLGANPIVAARVILLLSGVVFAYGVVALVRQLSGRRSLLAFAVGLGLALVTIPTEITPDFMMAGGLTWYFTLALKFVRRPGVKNAVLAAAVGGLCYYLKAFALPLVLGHLVLCALTAWVLNRRELRPYKLVLPLVAGLVATVAVVAPWVAVITAIDGHFTTSTTAYYSSRSWGPLGLSGPYPHYDIQMPRQGRIAVWENPAEAKGEWPTWMPKNTPVDNQIRVIELNAPRAFEYVFRSDLLAMLGIAWALTLVLSVPKVGPGDGATRLVRLWAFLSAAMYLGGYMALYVYDRFIWGMWGLLAAMAVWLVLTLRGEPVEPAGPKEKTHALPPAPWRRTASAMLVVLLAISIGWRMCDRMDHEMYDPNSESQQGHWMRQVATEMKGTLGPGKHLLTSSQWHKGLYFSYWAGTTYLGSLSQDFPTRLAPYGPTIIAVFDNPEAVTGMEQYFARIPGLLTKVYERNSGGARPKLTAFLYDPSKLPRGTGP